MKKLIVLFAIVFTSSGLYAQQVQPLPKNVIKFNLSGLVFRNYSAQYERQVGPKGSIALAAHVMPMGKLPFTNEIRDRVGVQEVDFDKMRIGSFGIVPEYRFYLGNQALKGFYIGVFGQYANYKMDVPITYGVVTKKTGLFTGEVDGMTGGIQIGAHFNLGKSLSLDWWIFGPNLGQGNGDLDYVGALDPVEQQSLRDQIDNIRRDIPLDIIRSYDVNATGAHIAAKGPIGGLRGFGFNLGLRF